MSYQSKKKHSTTHIHLFLLEIGRFELLTALFGEILGGSENSVLEGH